jgi:hypothetical protein
MPVFFVWNGMVQRCINPNNKKWADYGGRGILVCERWRTFENFYADMGDRPDGMSLDRIDNDEGYSPGNVRWATATEQARNQRSNVMISFDGVTQTLRAWADQLGIHYSTLKGRHQRGEAVSDLFRPVKKQGARR